MIEKSKKYLRKGGRMRIKIDRVRISFESVFPSRLDVRNLQRITDGLHVGGTNIRRRAEYGRHSSLQD